MWKLVGTSMQWLVSGMLATYVVGLGSVAQAADKHERLEIVDRSIAFHGFDRLDQLEVDLVVGSRSGAFHVIARPGALFDYRVTPAGPDGGHRVHHQTNIGGELIEMLDDGKPEPLRTEDERQRARDFISARVYFLFLPYRLNDPETYKEDLGLERWGERQLERVRVTFQPGTSTYAEEAYVYWFDPETARLEQFAYSFPGGIRFRKLVNYRKVGGLLIFDQENYARDASDATVDWITPETAPTMPLLSVVKLTDVSVKER